jgi:hypothetical protein
MNEERILMRSPSESAERQRADYRAQKEKLLLLVETGGLVVGQKECFKCQKTKPLDEFYLHPQMADGRLGKCKTCTKLDAGKRLIERRQYVREYDQWRQRLPSRRLKKQEYHKRHNRRYPEKAKARELAGNAVRDGRLAKKPCEVCGDPIAQKHHSDYSKPLEVQWLCFKHHREMAHGQRIG